MQVKKVSINLQPMRILNHKELESRVRLDRIWAPVFIMTGVSVLSGTAGVQTGGWSFTGMDKLGHLVVFGLLGIAWARSFKGDPASPWRGFLLSVLLASAFGMLDEMHQYHNPLRTFEWGDLLADIVGSAVASWMYLYVKPVQRLLETKISQYLRLPSRNNRADSVS